MGILSRFSRSEPSNPEEAVPTESEGVMLAANQLRPEVSKASKPAGRIAIYAVRVRETFKGEILALQAELQLARLSRVGKARKVTEGEVMEYLLDTVKAMRRDGDGPHPAIALPNDVCLGVHEIARHWQCSPAEAVEQIVAGKLGELELVPHRHR